MADSKGNSSAKIRNKNNPNSNSNHNSGQTDSSRLPTGDGSSPAGTGSHKHVRPNTNRKEDRNQSKKYSVKQRPPTKVSRRLNDVYIGEASSFQSQYVKCQQLLDGGQKVIYLHGIGDAIPRALNLATKLKIQYLNSLEFSVTTSSVQLVDDLLPQDDHTPPSQNYRTKSAVDIKIFRTVELP